MKHCVELNTQTNLLIDTDLSAHCRILRIVEFDLNLLDCSKKPTIWTWVAKPLHSARFQYCKLIEDSSWFNIHWTAIIVLEKWVKGLGLFLPCKNINSLKMNQKSIRLLNKNNQWAITLLSHISEKKNSKYKTVFNYNEENNLFKEQKRCMFQSSWFKI